MRRAAMSLHRGINMKNILNFGITLSFALALSACGTPLPTSTPIPVDAAHPCVGAPAPVQWHHIVVLIFENKTYDQVIGPAPYITNLANQCATSPDWKDA